MTEYMTDQEQLDQIKKFWKQYRVSIIIGLIVGVIVLMSWRHWQFLRVRALEHASVRYEQLLTSVANDDNEKAMQQAGYLVGRYPESSYAKLATLLLARNAIYQGNYADAEEKLRWVMDSGKVPAFRQIARLRLARLLLQQNKSDAALVLVDKLDDKNYQAAADEIRGDILIKMHKPDEARKAYANALALLPDMATTRPLLQMKLDNLASLP